MAIYHFRLGLVQRARGHSAVAVASDRARMRLYDTRLGQTFSPLPEKRGAPPLLSEILLPPGAPAAWRDRQVLWNAVEAQEAQRNACLAREAGFALPEELTSAQAAALARDYVLAAFVDAGMVADLNVHWVVRPDGQAKPLAQVLLTTRRCGPDGFAPLKERSWSDWSWTLRWRGMWADMANACLAGHGHAARIDPRSIAEQGIARRDALQLAGDDMMDGEVC